MEGDELPKTNGVASPLLSIDEMVGNDETDQRDASPALPLHSTSHGSLTADPLARTESGILRGMTEIGSDDMNATMTASHASLLQLSASERSLKRLDQESFLSQTSLSRMDTAPFASPEGDELPPPSPSLVVPPQIKDNPGEDSEVAEASRHEDPGGMVSPDEGTTLDSHGGSSIPSISDEAPLKATTFKHLGQKYKNELEYMLREFQKLEQQLLGAKTMQSVESSGSRERREKLHSFILHLDDTIKQIRTGCELEAAGQSTVAAPLESTSLAKLTREKEEEENVQKLEEHILANLLPVKVRLKKQLAAQQGAKHNPAGMPVRGVVAAPAKGNTNTRGTGTFMTAAQRTQFGKPLDGEGSSLTQKLHGQTLGSESRIHGDGVGRPTEKGEEPPSEQKKILFAGMALGSRQMKSSLTAASTAHRVVVHDPELLVMSSRKRSRDQINDEAAAGSSSETDRAPSLKTESTASPPRQRAKLQAQPTEAMSSTMPAKAKSPDVSTKLHQLSASVKIPAASTAPQVFEEAVDDVMTAEERRKLRRKRRKKKRLQREQHQQQSQLQLISGSTKRKKNGGGACKKRGPRGVEYMCALCNEVYNSTCDYNPWWALSQQECPKCRKVQVPRVDIGAPANAIEYHPALLAHADDNANGGGNSTLPLQETSPTPPSPSMHHEEEEASESEESDLSDDDMLSDSSLSDESDPEVLAAMSPAERAEIEKFGEEYDGPKFTDKEASRLLPLMLHASTCPCCHKSSKHRDVCRSTKWMMMHVRDCPGTTSTFDVCPFPWCRKIKHLLYHLVTCTEQASCEICSSSDISGNICALRGLNEHRLKKWKTTVAKKTGQQEKSRTPGVRQSKASGVAKPPKKAADLIPAKVPSGSAHAKTAPVSSHPKPASLKKAPASSECARSNPVIDDSAKPMKEVAPASAPVASAVAPASHAFGTDTAAPSQSASQRSAPKASLTGPGSPKATTASTTAPSSHATATATCASANITVQVSSDICAVRGASLTQKRQAPDTKIVTTPRHESNKSPSMQAAPGPNGVAVSTGSTHSPASLSAVPQKAQALKSDLQATADVVVTAQVKDEPSTAATKDTSITTPSPAIVHAEVTVTATEANTATSPTQPATQVGEGDANSSTL